MAVIGGDVLTQDPDQPGFYGVSWKSRGQDAITAFPYPRGWGVQFASERTPTIGFLVYPRSGAHWNIYIDGHPAWLLPHNSNTLENGPNLITFELPDAGLHTIQFYMNNMTLSAIYAEPGGQIIAAPLSGPKTVFLGDSITEGAWMSTGGDLGSWIWNFSRRCGFENVWNDGVVATGPLNTGHASTNYRSRAISDVIPAGPDLVFITSYYNDRTKSPTDIASSLAEVIDILRTSRSRPKIYLIGSYDPLGQNASPYQDVDNAIRPMAASKRVPFIEPRTGLVYDSSGVVTTDILNSGPWITAENRAVMIGSDGKHLTDLGEAYFADRMVGSYNSVGE